MADGTVTVDDALDMVTAQGVSDLKRDVAEVNRDIKESEAFIRREVAKSESDIRADVLKSNCDVVAAVKDGFCAAAETTHAAQADIKNTLNVNNLATMARLCEIEKQALRAEYEAKLTAQMVIKEVIASTAHNSERLGDKIEHAQEEVSEKLDDFEDETEESFENFERRTTEKFFHAREEHLEEEIDELRAQLSCCKAAITVSPLSK